MNDKNDSRNSSPDSTTADFTLRHRLIEVMSLQQGVTNSEIVDIVSALVEPASTVPQADYRALSVAQERLKKALNTLSQVNRVQASMLEDVFVGGSS